MISCQSHSGSNYPSNIRAVVGGQIKTVFFSYFADVDISEENNSHWQKSVDTGHKIGIETEGIISQ